MASDGFRPDWAKVRSHYLSSGYTGIDAVMLALQELEKQRAAHEAARPQLPDPDVGKVRRMHGRPYNGDVPDPPFGATRPGLAPAALDEMCLHCRSRQRYHVLIGSTDSPLFCPDQSGRRFEPAPAAEADCWWGAHGKNAAGFPAAVAAAADSLPVDAQLPDPDVGAVRPMRSAPAADPDKWRACEHEAWGRSAVQAGVIVCMRCGTTKPEREREPAPAAEAKSRWTGTWCPQCGPDVRCDEDGCCAGCGVDCVGPGAEQALALRAELAAAKATIADFAERLSIARAGIVDEENNHGNTIDRLCREKVIAETAQKRIAELDAELAAARERIAVLERELRLILSTTQRVRAEQAERERDEAREEARQLHMRLQGEFGADVIERLTAERDEARVQLQKLQFDLKVARSDRDELARQLGNAIRAATPEGEKDES